MTQLTTNGITVQVETFFSPEFSNSSAGEFVFAYRITIHNKSNETVKLLGRHWNIIDAGGVRREVRGEGVVGEQPIIEPQQSYTYMSSVNLNTEMGTMFGAYNMRSIETLREFNIYIPQFYLEYPYKGN